MWLVQSSLARSLSSPWGPRLMQQTVPGKKRERLTQETNVQEAKQFNHVWIMHIL